ncbi:N-acetylmuramic acid 6-phosphate etherase [Lactococcus formosensis]|uniref:N-acetylmuramic acid 6-phosphate etherase n=1 Tax=Lactococcus formosensis TaxID=1281486 RepID=A0A9X4SGC0_9LACT|nr:N-acetylmuramic acid 6-phosphate etherase [Lactococcus formosensis]MCH1723764.1 N-acetylmuramic acid 6-phosphate etherase [Lactococcus formosensis]MCO7180826.1 N-acetylmuramic acid 6-phosphate etherase [Lactococcus formosensis]MDG6111787.1 N-acetylmuramic acid 6-phosphate etherase [Lactococcus formosensis]MDG6114104.1 N-acetylmuramic acid 6-phosphate etherase [Lactococcus formosensis]MDG6116215.1 N-acetylmuramic acid 6-phosphate etherase [Lactococcus formosensis]
MNKIESLSTEGRNPNSMNLDQVSTLEMVKIMNNEDAKVAAGIATVLPQIATAIDRAAERFTAGGRIIYIGAGTSGRLGLLDGVELTPTYSVPSTRAFGIIAGGDEAVYKAIEGAEDSRELGLADIKAVELTPQDILIGLSASGRTPYVLAALEYAKKVGALTISVSANPNSEMATVADVGIDVAVGPEVITGSTRMKSGTAQKMVLNMISSGIMVKTGKVYQNLMINVQATNEKLVNRGIRIVSQATGVSFEEAEKVFYESGERVNVAILMLELNVSSIEAKKLLKEKDGNIANVIRESK